VSCQLSAPRLPAPRGASGHRATPDPVPNVSGYECEPGRTGVASNRGAAVVLVSFRTWVEGRAVRAIRRGRGEAAFPAVTCSEAIRPAESDNCTCSRTCISESDHGANPTRALVCFRSPRHTRASPSFLTRALDIRRHPKALPRWLGNRRPLCAPQRLRRGCPAVLYCHGGIGHFIYGGNLDATSQGGRKNSFTECPLFWSSARCPSGGGCRVKAALQEIYRQRNPDHDTFAPLSRSTILAAKGGASGSPPVRGAPWRCQEQTHPQPMAFQKSQAPGVHVSASAASDLGPKWNLFPNIPTRDPLCFFCWPAAGSRCRRGRRASPLLSLSFRFSPSFSGRGPCAMCSTE